MQKNPKNRELALLPYLAVIAFFIMMAVKLPNGISKEELNYPQLQNLLNNDKITEVSVTVDSNTVRIDGAYEKDGRKMEFYSTVPNTEISSEALLSTLTERNVEFKVKDANAANIWISLLSGIIPMILFGAMALVFLSKMSNSSSNKQAFDFSKSRARLENDIKVRFSDVAGCDEEKEEMAEIIDYLKSPRKFSTMGARIPRGILLAGSPGTGKTLLAKAVAGEANVPFYSISGSDFVEMFVGVGASRVRDMFKVAKRTAPCMIFIDEIDAVGRQRGAGMGGGHDEREQTLNQILVEMDGMADNNGIVVIAATNRPDVLDPALLRPGRFDRQIVVSLPDLKGRAEILKVHARNKKLAEGIDLEALARRTPGFSGADLENVLNEAAILAVRENRSVISSKNIDEAIDRVMMGPAKKSRTYDEHTKKLVAYHEAGHAIVGLNLPDGAIVQKVTIIPRGNAGGYNLITPRKERIINTRKEMIDTITSYMGGRAAEEAFFDDITTGASGDIQSATRLAKDMVTTYGMSELGPVQYDNGSSSVFLGRDYNSPSNASSQVAYEIDQEVRKIIDYCHDFARKIIDENKDDLVKIAEALIERETLTAEEIHEILHPEEIVTEINTDEEVVEETVQEEETVPQEEETSQPEQQQEEPKRRRRRREE